MPSRTPQGIPLSELPDTEFLLWLALSPEKPHPAPEGVQTISHLERSATEGRIESSVPTVLANRGDHQWMTRNSHGATQFESQ